jgi:hypothetical protein
MGKELNRLDEVALVAANFGNGLIYKDILLDWFRFLGGKPGEVVVVDGGSDINTQIVYWELYRDGLIDKLQVIQPHHQDNDKETCYIQEYTAGAIARKPYILFFKIDTLPYREGHDNWLEEAINYLDRDDVFAVGGSFNLPSKLHDAWPGWYFSYKCSLNFSLMKRSRFMAAMHELAGSFITSGFKGENPGEAIGLGKGRYLVEVAFEEYIQRHKMYTLCKIEDPTWTVFHTNTLGERLKKTREKYFARKDIKRFMNVGFSDEEPNPAKAIYYGKPPVPIVKSLQIMFGASPLGPYWRELKKKLKKDVV